MKHHSEKNKQGKAINDNNDSDNITTTQRSSQKEEMMHIPMYKLFRFASKKDLMLIISASLISIVLGAIQPASVLVFGRLLATLVLGDPQVDTTRPLVIGFVVMGTCAFVGGYFSNCFWVLSGENQTRRIRLEYVHAVLRQEMGWFDVLEEGSLTTRLATDTQTIQEGISDKFGTLVTSMSQIITGLVVAFITSWRLAIVILSVVPLLVASGAAITFLVTRYAVQSQKAYADAGAVAEQVLGNIRTVYAFSLQHRFADLFDLHLQKAVNVGVRGGVIKGIGFGAFMCILFSTYALSLWYGTRLIRQDLLDGPSLFIVLVVMISSAVSMLFLPSLLSAISNARASATKLYAIIDRVPEIDCNSQQETVATKDRHDRDIDDDHHHHHFYHPKPSLFSVVQGHIQFHNVHFAYPSRPNVPILRGLSLTIQAGMTVAFVGSSGSGKSTCVQLLQRFYDPSQGKLLVDGHDIRTLSAQQLRRCIGVVSQEPSLFAMTIRENIMLGVHQSSHSVSEDDLVKACKQANCHEFITRLPQGYDTMVNSGMLSGGQKQRIAIARAIVKSPAILLLDEATSALDTHSEKLVQQALDAASRNRTTIVIAHRLSTIRNADVIVVMDRGRLVEQGTHAQLIAYGGLYADLVSKQTISTEQGKVTLSQTTSVYDKKRPSGLEARHNDWTSSSPAYPFRRRSLLASDTQTTFTVPTSARPMSMLSNYHYPIQHHTVTSPSSSLGTMTSPRSSLQQPINTSSSISITSIPTTQEEIPGIDVKHTTVTNEKLAPTAIASSPLATQEGVSSAPIMIQVLRQMRPEWHLLSIGCLCAGIAGMALPLYAMIFATVITTVSQPDFGQQSYGAFEGTNLHALFLAVIGVSAFIGFLGRFAAFETAAERYTRRLRLGLFTHYMTQEVGFFDKDENAVGVLSTRLAIDAKNLHELVTLVWSEVAQVFVTACAGLVIAFIHSWMLSLTILCMIPLLSLGTGYESMVNKQFQEKLKKASGQSDQIASEAFREIRTVTSLARQDYFEHRYAAATMTPHRMAQRKAYLASLGYGLSKAMNLYTNAVAFYAGSRLLADGQINIHQLLVTVMTMLMAAEGIGNGGGFTATYMKAKYSAMAAFSILARQSQIDPTMEGKEPRVVDGKIDFTNVSFRYPARPDVSIFSGDFNLHSLAGQTIALVGESGCGKSTTIGLLERWYDPLGGVVALDDQDLKTFTLGNLRSHMALVGQEPVLFDATIRENVLFGAQSTKQIDQADIEKVCEIANIHHFIMSLPDGYNTRVGDKGSNLSGGQKQRIAIARALIGEPKILLLDEATSALDSESEKQVQEAIDKILKQDDRTTITIAHRLSTIQNADVICVVKNGRIIEQGSHWQLLEANGAYANLVYQQSLNVN